MLAGCARLGPTDPLDEVRREFARDQFCPYSRVTAKPLAEMVGSPPPAVASDPDRLAMWQHAMLEQVNGTRDRQTFSVSGCGDLANYTCWDYSGEHDERGVVVCMMSPGTAAPVPSNAVIVYPHPADSTQ